MQICELFIRGITLRELQRQPKHFPIVPTPMNHQSLLNRRTLVHICILVTNSVLSKRMFVLVPTIYIM